MVAYTKAQRQQHIQLLRKIQALNASVTDHEHGTEPNAPISRTPEASWSDSERMISQAEDDVLRTERGRVLSPWGFIIINVQVDGLRSEFLNSETITVAFGGIGTVDNLIGTIAYLPRHLCVTITASQANHTRVAPHTGLRSQALQFLLWEEGVRHRGRVQPYIAPCAPTSTSLDVNSRLPATRQSDNVNSRFATGGNSHRSCVSNTSDSSEGNHSRSMSFTHGEYVAESPESPAMNDAGSEVESQVTQNRLLGRPGKNSDNRMTRLRNNSIETAMADGHSDRKEKPSAQILPCPIENCPGRDTSISELMRKLNNSQHSKFICPRCWCLFVTRKELNGHTPCEDHCVISKCKPGTAQDSRHKFNRGSCMDKNDVGGMREIRKEDEYRYICGLLGVASLPLLGGLETPHKGQRKSPSKKNVAQDAANRVVEAERLSKSLEIENQELRRHIDDLKTAAQANCDREEELVQIMQKALEEHESMTPQITKALYRRIEHWAPNIIKELPHAINPFGDITTRTQDSPSVPSPDPLSNPSISHRASDLSQSGASVISQSSNSPYGGIPELKTRVEIRGFLRSLRTSPGKLKPIICGSKAGGTQYQHRQETNLTQNLWAGLPSSEPDSRPPQETTPMLPSSAHLTSAFTRISTDFPSDNWESATFQPQGSIPEGSALYNMDFSDSQLPNGIFHPQEPNVWDDSLFTGLLSTSAHGGDGVNDSFLGDFLAS